MSIRRALCAVITLTALFAGTALPAALAAHGGVSIRGTAVSDLPQDNRKLTVSATAPADDPTAATGRLEFNHHSPDGLSRFTATVTCLTVVGDTVQLSGIVHKGLTAAGVVLDGRAVAFTITGQPGDQTFSLPRLTMPTDAVPCGGGRPDTVPVTSGGLRLRG